MKCAKCGIDLPEKLIHESHDVPCYLFEGNRKGRKNQGDKHGRHLLCKDCHNTYEKKIRLFLQRCAKQYSEFYF